MNDVNPFPVSAYHGPEFFCNREDETRQLITHAHNGVNTTLLSIRRMGKTGLIQHAFNKMAQKAEMECVYVDIYATQNLKEFTNYLNSAVLRALPEKKPIGKKFLDWMKGFKPVISYDPISGQPDVSFEYSVPRQYEQSLQSLFEFLDRQDTKILIAIDEFQQITQYPEKNVEALLRSFIQKLKNVHFIFSGSSEHLLNELFNNSKRPFFASTQLIHLKSIKENLYRNFIAAHFENNKRKISREALDFILAWTRCHTYYTQALCNRMFSTGLKQIEIEHVHEECGKMLSENEASYYIYRNLLAPMQWALLKAIAKEEKVYHPTARQFLQAHRVGTPANVQRALEALLTKEMVFVSQDEEGKYYQVYDCFLSRWLENLD
jgi:AAA+ ATPase superfamily predicted ATPase